jgi:hypothetical protein
MVAKVPFLNTREQFQQWISVILCLFPPPAPAHPTKPLVRSSCSLYEKQFRFPVCYFFIRILLFLSSEVLRVQCIGQQFWGWRWGGSELRLGNDLLSTFKMGLCGDLESMGRRGDFVNCALLDLFFFSFAVVQIFALKLPPRFLATCYGPGYMLCDAW